MNLAIRREYYQAIFDGESTIRTIMTGLMILSDNDETNLGSFMIIEA
jgi:hypothetical protein